MSSRIFGSNHPLIAYLMAGYPTPEKSLEAAKAIFEAGADAIELGVPFSDPIADGPVIQKASSAALKNGVTLRQVLRMANTLRVYGKPIYVMSYLNPILRMGYSDFASNASESGVAGVIIPDLPVELAGEWTAVAWSKGLETVFLATPATSQARFKRIARDSTGFVYLVSVYGITGVRESLPDYTFSFIRRAKSLTDRPLALGFGISNPRTVAEAINAGADGVIVGSLLVSRLMADPDWPRALESLRDTVRSLKQATVNPEVVRGQP